MNARAQPSQPRRSLDMARLTLLIDPAQKRAFDALCAAQDLTTSQVVRTLIADCLRRAAVSPPR